jgi:hypothetical protein
MAIDLKKYVFSWRGAILIALGLLSGSTRDQKQAKERGICECTSVDVLIAQNPQCNCRRY